MRLKRLVIWVGGALALGAMAGSIAWFVGRSTVESRIAEAVAEADARGWTVSHGPPRIGGFPLAYDIVLPDTAVVNRETGLIARLPELQIVWEGAEADRLTLRLPPEFEVVTPIAEDQRAQNPALPTQLVFNGEAEDVRVVLRVGDEGAATMGGKEMRVRLDQDDYANKLEVALSDFAAEFSGVRAGPASMAAARAEVDLHVAADGGPVTVLDSQLSGLSVDLQQDTTPFEELFYAGADGLFRLGYAFTQSEGRLAVSEDPQGLDGVMLFSSGEGGGVAEVTGGALDLVAETRDAVWSLTSPDRDWGSVTLARTELGYRVPTSPTTTPQPGRLKLALEQVEGTPEFWQGVDPGGKLDRMPGNLALDLGVTARLMARMDRLPAGFAPPYEVANLMVNQAYVQALGASLQATGDIEIVQPAVIPEGRIEINGTGLSALIAALAEAGFLTPDMKRAGDAILQVYARPGEAPDTWVSQLRVGREGVSVNGLPVQ